MIWDALFLHLWSFLAGWGVNLYLQCEERKDLQDWEERNKTSLLVLPEVWVALPPTWLVNSIILRPLMGTCWILKSLTWRCLQSTPRVRLYVWLLGCSIFTFPETFLQNKSLYLLLRSFPVYQGYPLSIMTLLHTCLDRSFLWRYCLI